MRFLARVCLPSLQSVAVWRMLCVRHCHSTVVPSPLALPLIASSTALQTLCPEERMKEGPEGGKKGKDEVEGREGEERIKQ